MRSARRRGRLRGRGPSNVPVSIYVAIACVISGVSALLARETKGVELSEIR